ncbi:MAG: hypothetical protein EAZ51_03360 [Sphingobacteriales bacterium]|nr:MAG: hypothetical protein EAZ64_00300 [Sphingobacteriales bacterium]TAF81976.1 MAG: hypothetical protein EAZ51_03360 [Sphingobacteriales bacterium]
MNDKWIKIYTSHQFFKAEKVKQILIDNGIKAVIMNKQDTAYKFGEVEVHIPENEYSNALEIIIEHNL